MVEESREKGRATALPFHVSFTFVAFIFPSTLHSSPFTLHFSLFTLHPSLWQPLVANS